MSDSGKNEISTITLKYRPDYVRNPITFTIMVDVIQALVNFKAREGYGLQDEDYHKEEDKEKIVQASKTITKERIESILETFYVSNFFTPKDKYDECGMTDQAFVTITALTKSGRNEEVLVYGGHFADLEDTRRFQRLFDRMVEMTKVDNWLKATFDNGGRASG